MPTNDSPTPDNGHQHQPPPVLPVCPYCLEAPARITVSKQQTGPFIVALNFCANPACMKVYGIQVLSELPPAVIVPTPGISPTPGRR